MSDLHWKPWTIERRAATFAHATVMGDEEHIVVAPDAEWQKPLELNGLIVDGGKTDDDELFSILKEALISHAEQARDRKITVHVPDLYQGEGLRVVDREGLQVFCGKGRWTASKTAKHGMYMIHGGMDEATIADLRARVFSIATDCPHLQFVSEVGPDYPGVHQNNPPLPANLTIKRKEHARG